MKDFFKNKTEIIKLAVIGVLYLAAIIVFAVVEAEWWVKLIVYLALYFAVGYEIILHAFLDFKEEPFNEKFLMVVASVGAFILTDFPEAVAVMFFFSVGELFEDYADERSERAIEDLVSMMETFATIEQNGEYKKIDVAELKAGDIMLVKVGERVSADGVLIDAEGYFDTSMITGESKPKKIVSGELVRSGFVASNAPVRVKATKAAEESSAAKIIELIKEAQEKKASSEKFITHFAKIYTPIVIGLAVLVAFLPPIFGAELSVWVRRALNLLVISCPCALVVSVPIAFFVGIGKAFERGIVVKGSAVLEKIGKAKVYAFDKTGTLTKGRFSVIDVLPRENAEAILTLAGSVERYSSHPIAKAITDVSGDEVYFIEDVQEIAGNGLIGRYMRKKVVVGSAKFARENGFEIVESKTSNTAVYVCCGDTVGTILIGDEVKENSEKLIGKLNEAKIKTVMLTGDNHASAKECAKRVKVTSFEAGLLPDDKVRYVEELKKDGVVAFVGDGINDAPVLSSADVSVAMGSGSDVAADCADVVIVGDDPYKINRLRRIAKKTMRVVFTNIIFSISVKVLLFALSVFGFVPLWLAIFGDVGVMILATLNSFALSFDKSL